jgi:hypothetical protein
MEHGFFPQYRRSACPPAAPELDDNRGKSCRASSLSYSSPNLFSKFARLYAPSVSHESVVAYRMGVRLFSLKRHVVEIESIGNSPQKEAKTACLPE